MERAAVHVQCADCMLRGAKEILCSVDGVSRHVGRALGLTRDFPPVKGHGSVSPPGDCCRGEGNIDGPQPLPSALGGVGV